MSGRGSDDGVGKVRRGHLIAGGLGALGVALLPGVRPASAANAAAVQNDEFPDPMFLGTENVAEKSTRLLFEDGLDAGFDVRNLGEGPGIVGSVLPLQATISYKPDFLAGVTGVAPQFGVFGQTMQPNEMTVTRTLTAPTPAAGVAGVGKGFGVFGTSELLPKQAVISGASAGVGGTGDQFGVLGEVLPSEVSFTPTAGVAGLGRVGVVGSTLLSSQATYTMSFALPGSAPISVGVFGTAIGDKAVGILANNPSGYALKTIGKVSFPGGSGVVPQRAKSVEWEDESISPECLVNVTLADDPGAPGIALHYAKPGDGVLHVALTGPAKQDTAFTYFVFHP